jgi:hypothetical protein
MIDFEHAQELARKAAEKIQRDLEDHRLVIVESVEFDEGWLFFFTTEKCLETKDLRYAPIGLGPIIIGKENGDAYQAGTGISNEMRVKQFKKYLETKDE